MEFLNKNKTYIMMGIIIFFIIVIFVGGIMLGKSMKEAQGLRASEKELKSEIELINKREKSSELNAQALIDSAGIYEAMAKKQAIITQKTNEQINNIQNETQKNINNIDFLSRDINVDLFSKYAQEYIDSSGQH